MAKRKIDKRERIPAAMLSKIKKLILDNKDNGEVTLLIGFPKVTQDRIIKHCKDNNIGLQAFVKKAVYNVLPVKYDVDKQFIFPFGKYTGETAGSVQEFDPSYLTWCCKNISGFELVGEMQLAPPEVEKRHVQHEEYKQNLRDGEVLFYGAWQADNTREVFARRFTPWGESRLRYLGTQTKE